MRDSIGPPLRAAALTALSLGGLDDLVVLVVGAVAIALVTAWLTVALIGHEMPEPDFQRLVRRSEALATLPPADRPPTEFDELVIDALDGLPQEFQEVLDHTPVIVSDRGEEVGAYGHYIGGTVARDSYPDRIIIYRDTLERDFAHAPELLRAQVQRTVRHEVAHHLGWDERGVRGLGL
jgi:predicted Zn-dependent protease with MMP-like domain